MWNTLDICKKNVLLNHLVSVICYQDMVIKQKNLLKIIIVDFMHVMIIQFYLDKTTTMG